jgi:hypothetical protein
MRVVTALWDTEIMAVEQSSLSEAARNQEIIYRVVTTSTAKGVSIHQRAIYQTGLSFQATRPQVGRFLAYRSQVLIDNHFIVEPDGGESAKNVWTGEIYIEPNSGLDVLYPDDHVSVWHENHDYWLKWHLADAANVGNPTGISRQLADFFELRDKSLSSVDIRG